jgi:5-deoxy-D-glucuronate isomerase
MRSPQIYLPGGLATAYDVYFVNVHYLPGALATAYDAYFVNVD